MIILVYYKNTYIIYLAKKVEDLEKRNRELEMKIEEMDNSTDAINNKLKAITTDYSNKQQTEAYLIEKNNNLCIFIYYNIL